MKFIPFPPSFDCPTYRCNYIFQIIRAQIAQFKKQDAEVYTEFEEFELFKRSRPDLRHQNICELRQKIGGVALRLLDHNFYVAKYIKLSIAKPPCQVNLYSEVDFKTGKVNKRYIIEEWESFYFLP